jgi:hypothetical protein
MPRTPKGKWKRDRFGNIVLSWSDGRNLYLQTESDIAEFQNSLGYSAYDYIGDSGKIPDGINWDYWNVAEHKRKPTRRKL